MTEDPRVTELRRLVELELFDEAWAARRELLYSPDSMISVWSVISIQKEHSSFHSYCVRMDESARNLLR
jgi:hypothetical protein